MASHARLGLSLLAALCASATLTMAVTAAYADGDPASDYLLTYQVFYPYYAKTHKASLARLQSTVADANKRHFTIRVAVITSPRGRRAGGTHSPTMTLNTYGHVMDELAGAGRIDAEATIREARASRVRQRRAESQEIAQETAKVEAAPT